MESVQNYSITSTLAEPINPQTTAVIAVIRSANSGRKPIAMYPIQNTSKNSFSIFEFTFIIGSGFLG